MEMTSLYLEQRIAEERMHELRPHGREPEWTGHFMSEQPRCWTMDRDGAASRSWQWLDCIAWHDVVAVRLEYDHGQPIDPDQLGDDGDYA